METLIITSNLAGTMYFLRDAKGFCIASDAEVCNLVDWCRANGYRARTEKDGKVIWLA